MLKSVGRRTFAVPSAVALALILATAAGAGAGAGASRPGTTVGASNGRRGHAVDNPGTSLASARLSSSAITWAGGPITAKTGEALTVYVSTAVPPELGTPQTWADFIAGLVHGEEIFSLTAYIATFAEMQDACGGEALGCYSGDRMVSMAETMFGVTAVEVVRHEYGHHIAFHRLNPPWRAIDWGPKEWASAKDVCRRTEQRSAYPGDEGDHYALNPGEAWAETYRLLDERKTGVTGSGWQIIDSSFYPDDAALQAAERDVLQPWTELRATVYKKVFSKRDRRPWTIPLEVALDGILEVTVTLPPNGLQDVALLAGDRRTIIAKGLWASRTSKRITTTVCGERSQFLRITQNGAIGRVVIRVSLP